MPVYYRNRKLIVDELLILVCLGQHAGNIFFYFFSNEHPANSHPKGALSRGVDMVTSTIMCLHREYLHQSAISGSVVRLVNIKWCRHYFMAIKSLRSRCKWEQTRVSSLVVELNLLRTVFGGDLPSRKIRVNILR